MSNPATIVRMWVLSWMRDTLPGLLPERVLNEAIAQRERTGSLLEQLETLAPGTLGHAYCQYCRTQGIDPPGEGRSTVPEWYAYHDVLRLLADYPPTPQGELELAAFTAGFSAVGWLSLIGAVMQFEWAIPLQRGVPVTVNAASIDELWQAYTRGRCVNRDLTQWNYRACWTESVERLRQRFGIPPRRGRYHSAGPV